jgi:hypothetical protein
MYHKGDCEFKSDMGYTERPYLKREKKPQGNLILIILDNVDRHKGYYDKSNKPGIKEQMLHDLICV